MIIYEIVNILNNKKYIGKTINDLEKRWRSHYSYNKKSKKISKLYNAFEKYGIENFYCKVIKIIDYDIKLLNKMEKYYIEKYETIKFGYNIAKGGDGGDTLSNHPNKEIIYEQCSKTFKKNKSGWTNKQLPEEMKNDISESLKIYFDALTEEERVLKNQKTSESLKGRKFSADHLENLRLANLGEKNPMHGKKSWCNGLTKETSSIINESAKKISQKIKEQYTNGRSPWNKNIKIGPMSTEDKEKRCKFTYRITSNCGDTWIIKVLSEWCLKRNIKKGALLASGKKELWFNDLYYIEVM